MYGLKTWDKSRAQLVLVKKPTKLMTNSRSIGGELKKKCDGTHAHQPFVDGRAKDTARYPPALCRIICRGVAKGNMQRQLGIRAVMEVGHGVHRRTNDAEEKHENPDEDLRRVMMSELGQEELLAEQISGFDGGSTALSASRDRPEGAHLKRLTHCKNRVGDITSSLAWDDLTDMKLEAGKVVEARAKEVTYLREKRVYGDIHRQYAVISKWNIIKTR